MVSWLDERHREGDSIAQHGFQHVPLGGSYPHGRLLPTSRRAGEFSGLDGEETRRAVSAGWRVLKLAGIAPEGFVAPAYAYTAALRGAVGTRFRWWADLLRVHSSLVESEAPHRAALSPAFSLTAGGGLARLLCPPLVRLGSLLPTSCLRVDVHPGDLEHPRHMLALEWVLGRNGSRRQAITYRELAGA